MVVRIRGKVTVEVGIRQLMETRRHDFISHRGSRRHARIQMTLTTETSMFTMTIAQQALPHDQRVFVQSDAALPFRNLLFIAEHLPLLPDHATVAKHGGDLTHSVHDSPQSRSDNRRWTRWSSSRTGDHSVMTCAQRRGGRHRDRSGGKWEAKAIIVWRCRRQTSRDEKESEEGESENENVPV